MPATSACMEMSLPDLIRQSMIDPNYWFWTPGSRLVGHKIMNHLEQLATEWLQYNEYIVRASIPVGPRPNGGYEGELDVIGVNLITKHLVHIECSLDADSGAERERKFRAKFERGLRYIKGVFPGLDIPHTPDQIVLHQFARQNGQKIGGGRLVTVRELIHEIMLGLSGTSPASGAVPSNLPLLRTLQVAADAAGKGTSTNNRVIPEALQFAQPLT
jgi:hypothetical protein